VSGPLLSAPFGGRVLGAGARRPRLAAPCDADRREVSPPGGWIRPYPGELPLFLASVEAIAAIVKGATLRAA
jgi:hypothetical protein